MEKSLYVRYGADIKQGAIALLEAADARRLVPAGAVISLKPNLVVSRPAGEGATTHPEIAAGIIEYFIENGGHKAQIIEGSWVGDDTGRAFSRCGYSDIAKKYGAALIDLKRDETVSVQTAIGAMKLCKTAVEADFMINLPVVKGHCQTLMTCALKNMKGCIPDSEKRRFHALGLHRPIAALAEVLKPHLTLADGICGDLDFEEGGNPVRQDRLFLAFDSVKADIYACRVMGIDPRDVSYIVLAAENGAGENSLDDAEIFELNRPEAALWAQHTAGRKVRALTKNVLEDSACSACYGALVHALARLDERGLLHKAPKIAIGQGYRKKPHGCLGVGYCTSAGGNFVPGCPPGAAAILEALERQA